MKRNSFTLLEILTAIALIIILAAMVLWGARHAAIRASEADTIAIMEEFTTALEAFYEDYGYYPVVDEDFAEIDFKDAKIWKEFTEKNKSYEKRKLLDGFGEPFLYKFPGKNNKAKFDLYSKGSDTKDDADDITNWKRN